MRDWRNKFNELPDEIKTILYQISKKSNKELQKVFEKFYDEATLAPDVKSISDEKKRYEIACMRIGHVFALCSEKTSVGKDLLFDTANDLVQQYDFKTTMIPRCLWFRPKEEYAYRMDIATPFAKNKTHGMIGAEGITYNIKEVLNHIEEITMQDELEILDRDKHLIALKNGILNSKTLEFTRKIDKEKFITSGIPVSYDKNASYEKWDNFVMDTLGVEKYRDTLQEFVGSMLYPGYPHKKLLHSFGDRDSGKSTKQEIIRQFLGKQNCSSLSMAEFNERFRLCKVYCKLANIRGDIDYTVPPSSIQILKSMTGGDTITAEIKYENPFEFINSAKIWFSSNGVPALPGPNKVDDAFYSRWIPLNYPYRFVHKPIPNDITQKKKDTDIQQNLCQPEVFSGILNWALEGLERLLDNKWKFSYSPSVTDVKKWFQRRGEWGEKPDPELEFLIYRTISDAKGSIFKKEMYDTYLMYCGRYGITTIREPNAFHRLIKNNQVRQVIEHHPTNPITGKQEAAWRGIRWKTRSEKA